jgi:hypothetical protein
VDLHHKTSWDANIFGVFISGGEDLIRMWMSLSPKPLLLNVQASSWLLWVVGWFYRLLEVWFVGVVSQRRPPFLWELSFKSCSIAEKQTKFKEEGRWF